MLLFTKLVDEVVEGETNAFDQAVLLVFRDPCDLSDPIGPSLARDHVPRHQRVSAERRVVTLMSGAVIGFFRIATRSDPIPILFKLVRDIESIKARGVIDKELSFAFLAKVFSLKKEIDRAVEAVSVGNIRAIEPALIAKLLDRKRE